MKGVIFLKTYTLVADEMITRKNNWKIFGGTWGILGNRSMVMRVLK
jgi:hypothetical protein